MVTSEEYIKTFSTLKKDRELAEDLGWTHQQVVRKRMSLGIFKVGGRFETPLQAEGDNYDTLVLEMAGLVNFIHNKKSGITVDIAKERLRQLQQ